MKKVPLVVDVDDKNCLAELTVALKLNHGARQRLYIVAGVLFFGSFFCTSKRKNIKTAGALFPTCPVCRQAVSRQVQKTKKIQRQTIPMAIGTAGFSRPIHSTGNN
jgi:hypothetical protein